MFISVIISDFFVFCKKEIFYKVPENIDVKIGNIVEIPFWKKNINGIITWIFEKPENIEEKKIKEIINILPLDFSLDEKFIKIIKEISEYYFAPITHCAQLFLPKNIFKAKEVDFKRLKKIREKIENNDLQKNNLNSTSLNLQWQKKNWLKTLNFEQQKILDFLEKENKVLIHWITWAWKTEVYKHIIFNEIKKGKQACLTVPEIALTPQLLGYFKEVFSKEKMAIIHSKITPIQKSNIWHWVKSWEIKLVIWSRSALFMPWKNLWVICVDEEHEWTYKNGQSPMYNLKKVAEIITKNFWNKLILWSATPDFWDYFEYKKQNKILEIKNRTNKKPLPKIEIVDLKDEIIRKNKTFISEKLKIEIKNSLDKKEQIILFLNQRWTASSIGCNDCWEVIKCWDCDISMTFHKKWNTWKLICHYCWKISNLEKKCKKCSSENLKSIWIWTQKIEMEIKKLFPKSNIFRADSDTTKSKTHFEELNEALKSQKIDILIWTQMIAKWFDLPNVTLVWVILADIWLNIPDFKAWEKTFQLLTQVAGRAWRWQKDAKILIQTFNPENHIIEYVKNYDYKWLFEEEIENRKSLNFPPFADIIKFSRKNTNINNLQTEVKNLISYIEKRKKEKKLELIIRNAPNFIPKIEKNYIWNIVIRWNIEKLMEDFDYPDLNDWKTDRDPNTLS